MGIFSPLFQKEQKKKHNLGVCIPDSSKSRRRVQEKEPEISTEKGFVVSGLFHVQDSLMVKGTAWLGNIKKKDKTTFGGIKLAVRDIQVENKDAEMILQGQNGALFLKAVKGKFPNIKIGDTLEF